MFTSARRTRFQGLSLAVTVALLATGTATSGLPAASAGTGATADAAATRPRAAIPQQTVKAADPKLPRTESWTPTSHTVTRTDGTATTKLFAAPKFGRGEDGWERLSGELTERPGARFPVRADDAVVPTWFGRSPEQALMGLRFAQGEATLGLDGATAVTPEVETIDGTDVVSYPGIFPGVDLQYLTTGSTIKEQFVLASEDAPTEFTFRVEDPNGLLGNPTRTEFGGYDFDGEIAEDTTVSISAPLAWESDADGTPLEAPVPGSAHQEVTAVDGGFEISLSVDPVWLQSKTYPIVLDPTISYLWEEGTVSSAYAPTGQTACSGSPCELITDPGRGEVFVSDESPEGTYAAYFHMNLSNIPPETPIESARFGLGYGYETYPEAQLDAVDVLLEAGDTGADLAALDGTPAAVLHSSGWTGDTWYDVDVTEQVSEWVATGTGGTAGFRLTEIPGQGIPEEWLDYSGGHYRYPSLTIDYVGDPLPPPIPVEQTWGCSCDWGHGADVTGRVADPINTADGNATETYVDVEVPAPGVNVWFARNYNGLDTHDGPLGAGWTHEYDASLTEDPTTGTIVFKDPSGGRVRFFKQPDGTYVGDTGVTADLVSVGGGWTLTSTAGRILTFDASGRELSDTDAAGNGVTLGYTGARLTSLTDATGDITTLAYGTTGAATGKLVSVATADGRDVEYDYTAIAGAARLTRVVDADGGVNVLSYDSTTGRLNGIRNPREHTKARNTYDPATGRVSGQLDEASNEWDFDWTVDPSTDLATHTSTDPLGNVSHDVYYGNVLTAHIDELGNRTSYYYDADLNVIATVDALGRRTQMTYDAAGNMLSQQRPGGPLELWTYDADSNQLTYARERDGSTKLIASFTYDSANRVTSRTDAEGGVATMTYTTLGLLETETTPEGHTTTYGYDADGNLTSVTSPEGNTTTYGYDNADRLLWETGPRGNVTGATAENFTTHYTYDAAGRVLTTTDPADTVTTNTYDPAGNLTTVIITKPTGAVLDERSYTYDELGRQLTEQHFASTVSTTTYDAMGRVLTQTDANGSTTSYTYDAAGRRLSMTTGRGNAAGADPADYTWWYGYDAVGNRIETRDPANNSTSIDYDALNRPVTATSPMGHQTHTEYNDDGQPVSTTDALGNTTVRTYTATGQLAGVQQPGMTASSYEYDDDGNKTAFTSPSGRSRTTWTYDADGRTVSQTNPRGNSPGADPTAFTTTWAYDAAGNQTSITDGFARVTASTYDRLNRRTIRTDARDHTTTWTYDRLSRLTSVTSADNATTSYDYDTHGRLVTRTNPRGAITQYDYDAGDQVTAITDPLGNQRTYEYDPDGHVTTSVAARGNATGAAPAQWTITQSYDSRGLRTALTTADAASSATYSYDDDGRMTQMTDATGTTQLAYDLAGRPTSITHPQGDYSYTYTDAGQVSSRTYPTGGVVSYDYNADGLMSHLQENTADTWFTYTRDQQLDTIAYPNYIGITETRGYNRVGLISSVSNQRTGETNPVSQYDYTRDAVGNPTRIVRTRGTNTHTEAFTYDELDRLEKYCVDTPTCDGATQYVQYDYDAVGNRLTENRVGVTDPGTITNTYNLADQLTASTVGGTTTTNAYDADGNLASDGRSYDVLNRLTSTAGPGTPHFGYDGSGNRRTITTAAAGVTSTRTMSWDINNPMPMLAVVTAPDLTTKAHFYGPDGIPVISEHPNQGQARSWYTHDAMGSITETYNGAGDQAFYYAYEPFGTRTETTMLVPSSVDTDLGYTGAYLEATTGEYHLRARDYNTTTGRFTTIDPIAPPITDPYVASYIYVQNRPLMGIDHTGQWPDWGEVWGGIKDGAAATAEAAGTFTLGVGGAAATIGSYTPVGWVYESQTGRPLDEGYWENSEYLFGVDGSEGWAQAGGLFFDVSAGGGIVGGVTKLCRSLKAFRTTRAAPSAVNTGSFALESLAPAVRSNVDDAISRAASGKIRFPRHDGKVYNNSDGLLPRGGSYTEWTAAEAGAKRGAHRVIIDGDPANPNAIYYWDHVNPPIQVGP